MRLQPPDQLSTVLVWTAAIFMAVREGIDKATPAGKPPVISLNGVWSFAPLALLLAAAVLTIWRNVSPPPSAAASQGDGQQGGRREPFLDEYLKRFVVIAAVMVLMSLSYALIAKFITHP